MAIDNFFTWELLATFAGCVTATGVVTELLKKFIKNIDPQIISFIMALVIMIVGQLVAKTFTWNDILLDAINAVVVSFAANGGFDAIKRLFGSDKGDGDNAGTIVLDQQEPGNSYISFNREPEVFKDGEELKLTIKTVKTAKTGT